MATFTCVVPVVSNGNRKNCSKTHHSASDAARVRDFKSSTLQVNSSAQSNLYENILLAIINGIFYETSEGRFHSSVRNKTIKCFKHLFVCLFD